MQSTELHDLLDFRCLKMREFNYHIEASADELESAERLRLWRRADDDELAEIFIWDFLDKH